MDELIIRALQGRATTEEVRRLQRWREFAGANERHYQAVARVWAVTGYVSPSWDSSPPSVADLVGRAGPGSEDTHDLERSADVIPLPVDRRLVESPEDEAGTAASAGSPARGPRYRQAAGAALVAALVGFGFGVGSWSQRDDRPPSLFDESEFVTGPAEMTTLRLGDGTNVRLGPNSRLRVAGEGTERRVWLEGRAFFGVQADPMNPFTVHTSFGDAEVFGTRFEVRTEEDEFRVLVVEGTVAVSAGGSEVELNESEMSRSVGGAEPSTEPVTDVYDYLDWLGNALVFQATSFDRALREIERRYGVEVLIEDPDLSNMTVTASFTGQSVAEVVEILCEIVGAKCAVEDEQIRVMERTGRAVDESATNIATASADLPPDFRLAGADH